MSETRRALTDLFKRGQVFSIADDKLAVNVWICKRTKAESEEVLRQANAAKARKRAALNDPSSPDYGDVTEMARGADKGLIVQRLSMEHRTKKQMEVEAEVAGSEEWLKDGLLVGLQESWNNLGFREKYAADPTDVEAKRVFTELQRFEGIVATRLQRVVDDFVAEASQWAEETLSGKYADLLRLLEMEQEWFAVYKLAIVAVAVREAEDHNVRIFDNPGQVAELLAPETAKALFDAVSALEVTPPEGKDSPAPQDS